MKKRKYDLQTLEETLFDTPRLQTNNAPIYKQSADIEEPEKVDIMYLTLLEHAREPGVFDYSQPQTYHSLFPDIEQEAYVEVDGDNHRKLTISQFSV